MAAIGEITPANPVATGEHVIASAASVPVVDLSDAITAALVATEIKTEPKLNFDPAGLSHIADCVEQFKTKVEPKPTDPEQPDEIVENSYPCCIKYVCEMNPDETKFICKMKGVTKPHTDMNYRTFVKEIFKISPMLAGHFALGYFDTSVIAKNHIDIHESKIADLKKIMLNYRGLIVFDMFVGSDRWTNMMIFDK